MYTIEDYIKYYGNRDFNDVKWNIQDTLICSILSYLIFNSYNKEKYLYQFFDSLKDYEEKIMKDYTARNAYNVLKKMINAKRYLEMRIINIEYVYNEKTMFGARTIKLDNKTIVAFKGSDSSAIAWKENFRDGYLYPTYTQNIAINYLNKETVFKLPDNILKSFITAYLNSDDIAKSKRDVLSFFSDVADA